jgi:geranylgeranyl diphosphate synthase, type I
MGSAVTDDVFNRGTGPCGAGSCSTGESCAQLLERTRALVAPAITSVIEQLPAGLRLVAGYHLGLWDSSGHALASGSGKMIRPALVLASCELAGGQALDAVPAAVTVELVHNFTLLHDDVMDGDERRRGRPAAWAEFGVPRAILAGDVLHTVAFGQLARARHLDVARAIERLSICLAEICEGQHDDCAFERRLDVSMAECLAMSEAKTGALLGCCCALGAASAGAGTQQVEALDQWGRRIGVAFQMVDDLLGIWGDPGRTGKPAYSDIAARKKSVPVTAALVSGTADGQALAELYRASGPMTAAQLVHAAGLIESSGARRWTDDRIQDLLGGTGRLLAVFADSPERAAGLRMLADLIVARDH